MANRRIVNEHERRDRAKGVNQGHTTMETNLGGQEFADVDKAFAAGAIAVFSDIKAPPFPSQSELIDMKIVLPAEWSSELLEKIEACIDRFGEEKGVGKTRVTGASTVDERN